METLGLTGCGLRFGDLRDDADILIARPESRSQAAIWICNTQTKKRSLQNDMFIWLWLTRNVLCNYPILFRESLLFFFLISIFLITP